MKLGRFTENVQEPITKAVRKHRYRLPRATLQLKLSTRMIHPTRHHAHQPLHKNIRLTGSETKTYDQYSLTYRLKNSKTDFIEQKTVLELRNVLKTFHSSSSATNKEGQNDIWKRKITSQRNLQKTECFVQNTSSKNTS